MPESRTGLTGVRQPSASNWAPFLFLHIRRKKEEVLIRPLPKFLLDLSLDSQLPEFRLHLSASVGRLGRNSQQTVGLPWVSTALEQLSLSEQATSPINSITVLLSSVHSPHLLPSHPIHSLFWHFSVSATKMQQPRPEPQTFAAGRAYCSLFKVFTQPTKGLSLSTHSTLCPLSPPPAPLRSLSCPGLSSLPMSCCSSWMVTSGGRRKDEEPELLGLLPLCWLGTAFGS